MTLAMVPWILMALCGVAIAILWPMVKGLKKNLKDRDDQISQFKKNLKVLKTGETNSLRASTTRDIIKEKMRIAKDDKELDKVCDFVVTTLVDGVRNMPEFH
jgi:hypothetical protein